MKCVSNQNPTFKAALPTSMKADFARTAKEAKKVLGLENGLSLLKMDVYSFPQITAEDTGIGKLNSKKAIDLIKFLTFYTGANAIKIFPFGEHTKRQPHFFCHYLKTATTIGDENINLFNLTNKEKYGNLLDIKDAEAFRINNANEQWINFENELGTTQDFPIIKPLKKAYENFKNHLSTPQLEQEFEIFKTKDRVKNLYPRLVLYPLVKDSEPELFKDFSKSSEKQAKFERYKEQYKNEIEFFQFKQFLADKEHFEGKEKVNELGKKLFGDCLIAFSKQELWANPDAFSENRYIAWGLTALNAKDLLNEDSEASKVLKRKISFYLEHFDGIRFDVGWWYAVAKEVNSNKNMFDFGKNIFDFIEKTAKEIKGEDFNTQNLIYEMDGFPFVFKGDWNKGEIKPSSNLKGVNSVLCTEYQHCRKNGWGHPEFFKKHGMSEDEFIIGTNNHDGIPLRFIAESDEEKNIEKRRDTIPVLSKTLKINEEILKQPKEFIKAKLAQLFTTKNQFLFYVEALGINKRLDDHTEAAENYRIRIDRDFESQYHTALQNGYGFNLMESLGTVMKSKDLDKKYPELFNRVSYFAEYLRKEGAKTEKEANRFL